MSFASKCVNGGADGRYLQQSLEDKQGENISLQERFPPDQTSRIVIANALFHTCCESLLDVSDCSACHPRGYCG